MTRTTRTKTQAIKHNSLTRHIPETNDPEPRVGSGSSVPQNNKIMNNLDFTNMGVGFVRVSKGYAMVSGKRIYCELWLSVERMNLKVKFKVPKGMSYSYVCSAKDAPFEDGQFLSYWIPKNVYFPVHFCGTTVNELVDAVVKHLQLKFFKESRKWLTKDEKTTAELLAMKCISREDLGWMLNCDVCDIPQAFWEYAKEYSKEYDRLCELQIAKHRAVKKWLTTPDGLEHLLANWPKYTDGKPFRPYDAILSIATRYDNIPAYVFSEIYNK